MSNADVPGQPQGLFPVSPGVSFCTTKIAANMWKDIANDGNLISVYKSEVYWAAIKPRLDRNYVLYENENFTTTDS